VDDPCYVIDTSALVDLRINYRQSNFPSLWDQIAALIAEGRAVAPTQVLHELERRDDELLAWVTLHEAMFREADAACAREVIDAFPGLFDPEKLTEDADPFVVALARAPSQMALFSAPTNVVVTHEEMRPGRIRIPDACRHYGIPYMRIPDLVAREQWSF
jgi:rRNA maturation endonuclease Nob1